MVSLRVVTDDLPVPELVEHQTGSNDVGVVDVVVMSDIHSAESPKLLDKRIGTETGRLLLLSSYNFNHGQYGCI